MIIPILWMMNQGTERLRSLPKDTQWVTQSQAPSPGLFESRAGALSSVFMKSPSHPGVFLPLRCVQMC